MTCIVGFVDDGAVWIGGDAASTAGMSVEVRADPKVFTLGDLVIGYTSSWRMGQLLQYGLRVPARETTSQTDMAWLVTTFADAVRDLFRSRGWLGKDEDREAGGTFLLGLRGRLYRVADDFQIARVVQPYDAIGCGGEIALGAMYATANSTLSPEARIRLALNAAAEFSAGVRGPFEIVRGGCS